MWMLRNINVLSAIQLYGIMYYYPIQGREGVLRTSAPLGVSLQKWLVRMTFDSPQTGRMTMLQS